MRAIDNKLQWTKIGEISKTVVLGKDILMFGAGCHLVFINITNGQEHVYLANNLENGDGVQCFNGSRSQNIFAFAEKGNNPRVFIKTFPNFEEICTLRDDPRGYIFIVFSESSLLMTLGDLPNYTLTVWNFRTGDKIARKNTNVLIQNQYLRCNLTSPVYMAQLGVNTTQLHVWDVFLCGKKCVLTEHAVKTPENCDPFTSVIWTAEGGLLVLDSKGCVFMVLPDYTLEKIIECELDGTCETSFALYKQGIIICGPTNEIRHYKKLEQWTVDWALVPPVPIQKISCRLEYFLGISYRSNILQLSQNAEECKYLRRNQSAFDGFGLIYPLGEYIVTLQNASFLNAFEVITGDKVSTLALEKTALVIAENPKFPYVAIGYETGHLELISYYEVDRPEIMTEFFLARKPITHVYFNECGTIFVAANFEIGLFFVIEGLPGGEMEVIGTVEANQQIAHSILVMSENCYRIFTIPVTSDKYIGGNKIVRYCIIKNKGTDVKTFKFKEKNAFYARLLPTFAINRDRVFNAIPYFGKTIDEIEIKRGDPIAKITEKTVTGHQMRNVHARIDKVHAITWAYDGLVIVRDAKFAKNIGIVAAHHRMDGGVKKAFVDPYGKYVISLGQDGVLVCTDLAENEIDDDLHDDLEDTLTSVTYSVLFSKQTIGFAPKGPFEGKCYLEYQELKRIEKERIICKKERHEIIKELHAIQKQLQKLLTKNIEGPENEFLNMLEFNLDIQVYNLRREKHEKVCVATEKYLRELIEAQNKIADFMIEKFWKKTKVPCTVIESIFANFEVANYALLPERLEQEALLRWIQYQREVEQYLNNNQPFAVWEPFTDEELIAQVTANPVVTAVKEFSMHKLTTEDEEEEEVDDVKANENIETEIAMSGSDLARFIEPETVHYLQSEMLTYYQSKMQWLVSKSDSYKLKQLFNKEFDGTMMVKQKEMSTMKERNQRLCTIVSEINYFSIDKINVAIEDPEWEQVENPKLIIEVKDNEVPITPYISPSEQSLINARLAEAERLRLLLLADDFRERALMAMMNGVLEVRWEDELKKNVPLPKCMIEKEPEHFNEEDLRTVRDYEEKVAFLNSERERYKGMLNAEYGKVATSVRDAIKKFNGKLSDLIVLKLDIDATVSQETFKINRMKRFQQERKVLVAKEKHLWEEISDNEKMMESLQKLLNSLNNALAECRSALEGVQLKDKFLDKAFKKDFQDMSLVVQEQASKLYKKRPKLNYKAINSGTVLHELARCILTNYRSLMLTPESIDFLKSLESLDQYVGIPPAVDEATYALICRHRRLRIEYEIKVKAVTVDVAQGEVTIAHFQKRLAQKRDKHAKLHQDLEQFRSDILHLERNKEIQIVLPRGLVEIPLTGSPADFDDATLIYRKNVEDINAIILRYGELKLKALQQAMTFRRKIALMEWEHRKKKMQIQDLEEKMNDIRRVKMTREVQIQLKSNKDRQYPFENEIEWTRTSYENGIQDKKDKIKKIKNQIKLIQQQNITIGQHINDTNVDVCELNLAKDHNLADRTKAVIDKRMHMLLERNSMVQEIEEKHHELLVLQTELELLRLKTYPTLKYKILQ